MKNKRSDLGMIPLIILTISNIIHLPLTFSIVFEQIQTGFGYGTNFELGVLYYWIVEIILIIPLIVALIFLILMYVKKIPNQEIINRIYLFLLIFLQIGLSNLFIFY